MSRSAGKPFWRRIRPDGVAHLANPHLESGLAWCGVSMVGALEEPQFEDRCVGCLGAVRVFNRSAGSSNVGR